MRKIVHNSGFGLIELLAALTIFLTLSGVLLVSYNSFDSRLTLDDLAHQIAQWVRAAQISGISIKQSTLGASGNQFPPYGLYFAESNPTQFIYFADRNWNSVYDSGGTCGTSGSECESIITLGQGHRITNLCGENGSGGSAGCGAIAESASFSISFRRPNPDAVITGSTGAVGGFSRAQVILTSTKGFTRMVEVWTTGQISVR